MHHQKVSKLAHQLWQQHPSLSAEEHWFMAEKQVMSIGYQLEELIANNRWNDRPRTVTSLAKQVACWLDQSGFKAHVILHPGFRKILFNAYKQGIDWVVTVNSNKVIQLSIFDLNESKNLFDGSFDLEGFKTFLTNKEGVDLVKEIGYGLKELPTVKFKNPPIQFTGEHPAVTPVQKHGYFFFDNHTARRLEQPLSFNTAKSLVEQDVCGTFSVRNENLLPSLEASYYDTEVGKRMPVPDEQLKNWVADFNSLPVVHTINGVNIDIGDWIIFDSPVFKEGREIIPCLVIPDCEFNRLFNLV